MGEPSGKIKTPGVKAIKGITKETSISEIKWPIKKCKKLNDDSIDKISHNLVNALPSGKGNTPKYYDTYQYQLGVDSWGGEDYSDVPEQASETTDCSHKYEFYEGLWEQYYYCTKCDAKKPSDK